MPPSVDDEPCTLCAAVQAGIDAQPGIRTGTPTVLRLQDAVAAGRLTPGEGSQRMAILLLEYRNRGG